MRSNVKVYAMSSAAGIAGAVGSAVGKLSADENLQMIPFVASRVPDSVLKILCYAALLLVGGDGYCPNTSHSLSHTPAHSSVRHFTLLLLRSVQHRPSTGR